ncbi:iron uptake transporter deferrochelatase/peroxidase subunit [Nocardioides sp. CER19]|uniref:iron uptake transporter deferrochelatase/peroxidase subunit n=1 Tax=Nocardioides sp. CER19 TaxID=3038538 RepID=UPI00244AFF0D|nr:iron uptake transporter deferrochelatase/peroxidase subunit [Nocardioides sp. CER19]MDH2414122.1 iron uptake transporter deferrochelatase/peroxidase subunit [Nocardioides sp. CER19]
MSRRGLLGGGVAAAGVAGAFVAGRATADDSATATSGPRAYAFRGTHQAGIVTPAQDRLHFAAFDVTTESREELVALLKAWTDAAERMTRGHGAGPVGPTQGATDLPPDDTGEAIGLPPSGLTITFGFGPGLFRSADGKDRFGLAARQPAVLKTLPHFPGDMLVAERSDGDLCIQACADDPQVAFHAIRNLARIAFGTASVRWSQLGFGRTSTTSVNQDTPRNLFGFKDGTANVKAEETADLSKHVWVASGDDAKAEWLAGGSYLVARRINMHIETWDRQSLGDQEGFVGRTKDTGAPLSGGSEYTKPDFDMPGHDGPVIPADSHVRLMHPDFNDGVRILRRGYNFVDGSNQLGGLDAGLFFLAYVRNPETHFVPIQTKMAAHDAMMEYLKVTGSALFAVPPGTRAGDYVGQALFEA